ncbi:GNAT family N-acetyltransferase [Microbacterium foliorum]|uniref:GNAT family N-acetyltransferase n=2 Tax=Microbacterium TaxID=33882 RepID=UPI003734F447
MLSGDAEESSDDAHAPELHLLERGLGIGRMLVQGIVDDLQETSTVKRIMLATSDADGLYAKFGFSEPEGPSRYMIRPMSR